MRLTSFATTLFVVGLTACTSRFQPPTDPLAVRPGTVDTPPPINCDEGRHPASVAMRRLTVTQYENAIRDIFNNQVPPSASYPGAYGASVTGYSSEASINEVGEQSTEQLMTAAEEVAVQLEQRIGVLMPSCASSGAESCAAKFIDTYGRRAYRRTVTADEKETLLKTYRTAQAAGASFNEATAMIGAHLLQSPQFLYVAEDAAGDAPRDLTAPELATRLAFLFWDSIPDDALLAKADSGALLDQAVVLTEAQRLLASPKADTAMARFFREWGQLKQLSPSDKDTTTFQFFSGQYADAVNTSFDMFALGQLRNGGTLSSYLTSTDFYVNNQLAPLYGLTAPAGGAWAKVQLAADRYAGMATQPLVLASEAHATESSYVFRGRGIRKRLMCATFGAPPGNAQAQFSAITLPPSPTGKEVSSSVRAQTVCNSCHGQIDPAGLAFEHFDAVGVYRGTYGSGKAIDTTGVMPLGDGSITFNSPVDLMSQLAEQDVLRDCLARQLFRFSFSRLETPDDVCAIKAVNDALIASNGSLLEGLMSVIKSDAFWLRSDP